MPDILIGFIFGACTTLIGAYVQASFRHLHFRKEQLISRYSELIGAATEEYERAYAFEIILNQDSSETSEKEKLVELDSKRHILRCQLHKLAFQIQMLETHEDLRKKAALIANAQPFEPFMYTTSRDARYYERLMQLTQQRIDFHKQLVDLVASVLKRHSVLHSSSEPIFKAQTASNPTVGVPFTPIST
jgi:hypothetical protein